MHVFLLKIYSFIVSQVLYSPCISSNAHPLFHLSLLYKKAFLSVHSLLIPPSRLCLFIKEIFNGYLICIRNYAG